MLTLLMNLCTRVYFFTEKHAPSNRLARALIAKGTMRWTLVTLLIGIIYVAVGVGCIMAIEAGWTKWLYLVFLLCFINSIKFVILAGRMLITIINLRLYERRLRKALDREGEGAGRSSGDREQPRVDAR